MTLSNTTVFYDAASTPGGVLHKADRDYVPFNDVALCGFKPHHGWFIFEPDYKGRARRCQRCMRRAERLAAAS